MYRLLRAIFLGLLGAGIVHIAVLLLLPYVTERDAWSELTTAAPLYTPTRISSSASTLSLGRASDPLTEAVACRFSLEDGPLHVASDDTVPFWAMSIYDRKGQNIFSFNDRTAVDGKVNFVVLTPTQTVELRKDMPAGFEEAVFVEADIEEGIVVIRALVPDRSWRETVSSFVETIGCEPQ